MPPSNTRLQRQRRAQFKAQGLVYIRGWVTPAQAEAIQAIMANKSVTYQPNHHAATAISEDAPHPDRDPSSDTLEQAGTHNHRPLQLRPKPNQPQAWSVWLGSDELGTVYRRRVDDGEQSVTVWVAYRSRGHSTRHETKAHAIAALLQEYNDL